MSTFRSKRGYPYSNNEYSLIIVYGQARISMNDELETRVAKICDVIERLEDFHTIYQKDVMTLETVLYSYDALNIFHPVLSEIEQAIDDYKMEYSRGSCYYW